RSLGMDVPVALALLLAYGASVLNTVRAEGQTYFDSVSMFIFFLSAGRYVEMVVRQRSLSMSEAVSRSLPSSVTRVRADGATERVPIRAIVAGDRLSIPRGAVIPVDGELAGGSSWVDESLVTGESHPVRKFAGDLLYGGAVNAGSAIVVLAHRDVTSSTLASVVALLERAQSARPAVALAADRVASLFVLGILATAGAAAAIWMAVDPTRAFPAALAVLVVTCPCALSLATPVAVAAAATRLARLGLLVTRPDALERLARVDTVVLDKTGTLTSGEMTVLDVRLMSGITRSQALAFAAALERSSNHPIAAAFAAFGESAVVADEVCEIDGRGISGRINNELWRLGRYDYVAELTRDASPVPALGDLLYLGSATSLAAAFDLGEQVRPQARDAVEALRSLGITLAVASGDRAESVARIAAAVGIEWARARLDPAQKIEVVRELQSHGRRALTIGDGVNDGPVLAASYVSCAMGQGSAIAQSAADFLLLTDALKAVPAGVATARAMHRVIRQNLCWAVFYNLAAVPLAAFGLVPPWLAAIGMSASSLVVVLNARRLAGADPMR
ncbi:MAG TPA: heavy metal translocating P-type ATPase, partial [Steroidobacteraceae bacterium]